MKKSKKSSVQFVLLKKRGKKTTAKRPFCSKNNRTATDDSSTASFATEPNRKEITGIARALQLQTNKQHRHSTSFATEPNRRDITGITPTLPTNRTAGTLQS
jgi:hypothetical protein